MKTQRLAFALVGVMSLAAVARAADSERYPMRRADQPSASGSIAATFTVRPGQSIQAAVDRCRPGDRIEVMPGTYNQTVTIDLDNITLTGVVERGERATLDGEGKLNDAALVSGHNFTISGFEIRNYKGNGVVVNKAENCIFRDLVTHDTGKYAVYPLQCKGVTVDGCVSSGVWDAAIYAGQCENVTIQNCEAYDSTIGIETENCVGVLMANNSAHDNSLGLLVVLLPNLPTKRATDARVINNRCLHNNHPNLSPPGNVVNFVQPGVGIAINGADNTEVTRNIVAGNDSFGIGLHALSDIFDDPAKLDVEPNPDNTFIHDNAFDKNGEDPAKVAARFTKFGAKGGDLFWSGKGTGNVWRENTKRTFPENLPGGAKPAAGVGGGN